MMTKSGKNENVGPCVGGPYDGKTKKGETTKIYLRTESGVVIGRYHFDGERWNWADTPPVAPHVTIPENPDIADFRGTVEWK